LLKRLKFKFICINMLIVTLMLAVIFGMLLYVTGKNMERQSQQMLQQLHQMQLHKAPAKSNIRVPYFMVYISKQGTIKVSSTAFYSQTNEDVLVDIAKTASENKSASGVLPEHDLRFSRQAVPLGERIIFIDISRDKLVMQDLLKICALICVVSLAVFFVISVCLAQWAVKPVDEAWKQQKQFVADASHELKTPLTVILTNAELLNNPDYDGEAKAQFAQSIHLMSIQMRGLVEGLLDLTRLDNGAVRKIYAEVDLSRLVDEMLLPFEPMYYEKGLELFSDIAKDLHVMGNDSYLRQVVDILLDNALKYADSGSRILVYLKRQGNAVLLSVSSNGCEISREDLKNIFKRFYRIDKVRNMNHSYGLGLSIAQSIVQKHNGRIWAESNNGINTFFVQLPLIR